MKLRVLFVGSGNRCRSQMAEALLRRRGGDAALVISAGITAQGLHPLAVEAMAELGLDIHTHGSKSVMQPGLSTFHLVITLCDEARAFCQAPTSEPSVMTRNPVLAGLPLSLHWPMPDPLSDPDPAAAMRRARDHLVQRIETLVADGYLAAMAESHERMTKVLDALEDGIIVHDEHRRIFVFNQAAERITGLRREEVVGGDCHEVFFPHGLCGGQCKFASDTEHHATIGGRLTQKVRFVRHDGEDRELQMAICALAGPQTQARHVLARLRDVTELNRLRQALDNQKSVRHIVGNGEAMHAVFDAIAQAALTDLSVLLSGEPGVGKQAVARAIHEESPRRGGPFVELNCGSLPSHALDAELFGHAPGALEGVMHSHKGRFELAHRGTLYLSEVGELSAQLQAKLLLALQERRVEPVGAQMPSSVDVRLICSTTHDLGALVQSGLFREDLYARLAAIPVSIPPLRQRPEDIPALVARFLCALADEQASLGASGQAPATLRMAQATWDKLLSYPWPGNVRELGNAIRTAALRCQGSEITPEHLPAEIATFQTSSRKWRSAREGAGAAGKTGLDVAAVRAALKETGGNKVQAAERLGVGRATLYRFLSRHPELST